MKKKNSTSDHTCHNHTEIKYTQTYAINFKFAKHIADSCEHNNLKKPQNKLSFNAIYSRASSLSHMYTYFVRN